MSVPDPDWQKAIDAHAAGDGTMLGQMLLRRPQWPQFVREYIFTKIFSGIAEKPLDGNAKTI